MTNSKKSTNNKSRINKAELALLALMSALNFLLNIIRMSFVLFVIPVFRYLIPQNIRSAIVRLFPFVIRPFAIPVFILIISSLNRYFTVRSSILQLREEIEQNKKKKEENNIPDNDHELSILNHFLKNSEDELYHIPGETIATITGAGMILAATGPVSILATAAASTLGSTLGHLAYETITFSYCRLRGVPNTSTLARAINRDDDFLSDNDDPKKPGTATPSIFTNQDSIWKEDDQNTSTPAEAINKGEDLLGNDESKKPGTSSPSIFPNQDSIWKEDDRKKISRSGSPTI